MKGYMDLQSSSFSDPAVMQITVNNNTHQINEPSTVSDVLEHLGLTGKRIAVEMNGEIVPKSSHASTQVSEGAKLEIVVAVGGG